MDKNMTFEVGINNIKVLEQAMELLPKNNNTELAEVIAYKLSLSDIRNCFTYWKMINFNVRSNKHVGENKKTTAHRYGKQEGLYGVTKRMTNILKLASEMKLRIEEDLRIYNDSIDEDDVILTKKEALLIGMLKEHAQAHSQYCKEIRERK